MNAQVSRAIVLILDSVGVGELPDAAEYGDAGSHTLAHVAEAVGGLNLPHLQALGLGNITRLTGVPPADAPSGAWGKMAEISKGKDTITGHWEMMGVITRRPFPVYPHGFPPEIIDEFESRIGTKILGNKAASGTEIIKELGEQHLRTGCPIVYTSADSVFQIACHQEVVPLERLYEICRIARSILTEPHNVQRVIARPFVGEPGSFVRTEHRKDFALEPTGTTLLDIVHDTGREVLAVGKVEDIFAGRGVSKSFHTGSNRAGIDALVSVVSWGQGSLVIANLSDFDVLYGHRNDPAGYAACLEEADVGIGHVIDALRPSDILVITADHGCDPTTLGTDHTREYVPLMVCGPMVAAGTDLGVRASFCDVASTVADLLGVTGINCGSSFAASILRLN